MLEYRKAKSLGGFEVDNTLEFRGLLDRYLACTRFRRCRVKVFNEQEVRHGQKVLKGEFKFEAV
jgi:hypothetical protein